MMKIFLGLAVCVCMLVLSSAWAQGLPDTGQTKCYNNTVEIPCPQPGQAFYGQDAEYVKARSYTDLGNGIVRDNVTGLEWQQASAPGAYTWQQALDYCAGLFLGDHDDWRLPTIKELSTLENSNIPLPGPTIDTNYFSDTVPTFYWSSTPNARWPQPWYAEFGLGGVDTSNKTEFYKVRAVRGKPLPANNFINNNDGTITDTATGLMWQQATAPGTYTWQLALDYVALLNTDEYLGYDDWRLPDRTELLSILDYSRYDPAIDPVFSTVASKYWSSTTFANGADKAWCVYFNGGSVYYNNKSVLGYVRAVRSGQYVLLGDLGNLCIEDYHCAEGETCENGICVGECINDSDCDDDLYCNGVETCVSELCVAGTNPCISQGLACNEDVDQCVACLDDSNCPAGTECVNDACIAITCTENWQCPTGFGCVGNVCVEEVGQWSYEQIDPNCMITSMWAFSETDMYVGGGYMLDACLYHYDGRGWQSVNNPNISGPIFEIWGGDSEDVYVAGLSGRHHYDGIQWTELSQDTDIGLWGFAGGDVFVSASYIKRYQGETSDAMLLPPGFSDQISGLWGTSEADMYAVASKSTILHYDGNESGQWAYFNTTGLEGTSYGLMTIWGTSSYDIFVGAFGGYGIGVISHYDGTAWTTSTVPDLGSQAGISGFWGSSPHDVYAVTFGGKVLHYDGTSWSIISPVLSSPSQVYLSAESQLSEPAALPVDVKLKAVYGISAESIYFGGDEGVVVHYTPDAAECEDASDCDEGYECVEGVCEEIVDNPPALTAGPYLAAGTWPVLPTSQESPVYLDANYDVLWKFSDDFASCPEVRARTLPSTRQWAAVPGHLSMLPPMQLRVSPT